MATKPTVPNDNWTDGNATKVTEPSAGKKLLGFIKEKPAFQHFNWIEWRASQWLQYLEDVTDELVAKIGDPAISNLDIDLSAGVFTITGRGGVTLSPTNRGVVAIPSSTIPGQTILLNATAPVSFRDDNHASSDLTNLGFGITETVDWALDLPFWIYVVNRNDTEINGVDGNSAFFIARNPAFRSTPPDTNEIGDTDAIPVNDSKNSILLLGSYTQSNYGNRPCQLIGGFRMRWSTTTDDWTVQTLGRSDGIGRERLDALFATHWYFPAGQNGASANSFMSGGATTPTFADLTGYSYLVYRNGEIQAHVYMSGDGGTDGSGATQVEIKIPVTRSAGFFGPSQQMAGLAFANSVVTGIQLVGLHITSSTGAVLQELTGNNQMQAGDFTNGNRLIDGMVRYRAFDP